jgi:predicted unusual protein kinase regulating ubiquinone biosynthesis (AarF/ABC1/UbiB family)
MQERLLGLLVAVASNDAGAAAQAMLSLGQPLESFDRGRLHRRMAAVLADHHDAAVRDIEVGRVMLGAITAAAECGMRVPPELTVLGKTIVNLDAIARALAPEFKPNEVIRRHANEILGRRMGREANLGQLVGLLIDTKEFVRELPSRLNRILDLVADNRVRVKVDALDETALIAGFRKVANRIAAGLVLAALIVAAALMMGIETRFTFLGYPAIAMVCFLAASAGGFWLVWSSLWEDRRDERQARARHPSAEPPR